jgi:hypothetical protein
MCHCSQLLCLRSHFCPCAVGFQPFGSSYRWDRALKWTILPLAFREEVETVLTTIDRHLSLSLVPHSPHLS